MIFSSLSSLIDSVFIAFRSAKYIVLKNSIFSILKLIFPFLLVSLGAYGIFGSYMLPMIIGFIVSFIILIYKFDYEPKFVFYDAIIKKIGRYSFGNYVAGFIGGLPTLLLPLIITNLLHPEITAYYYIAMMIANTLFIIPSATSSSLFAEGSHDEKDLKQHVKKAARIITLFLIPAIIITIFFGRYVLLLFGQAYSDEGYGFLNLLAFSGIFMSINSVFTSVFNVKRRVKEIIFRSLIGSLGILGLSYVFIQQGLGLLGIGYAWLIGQAIISLFFVGMWLVRRK
jgi:O-antigen/teichoic acid export membrane protein